MAPRHRDALLQTGGLAHLHLSEGRRGATAQVLARWRVDEESRGAQGGRPRRLAVHAVGRHADDGPTPRQVLAYGDRGPPVARRGPVWSHPASRCFPTCPTARTRSPPPRRTARRSRSAMRTTTWPGPASLGCVSPCRGGGRWRAGHPVGPRHVGHRVARRRDRRRVCAEAAHAALRRRPTPVSTRCDDGEVVQGRASSL